MCSSGMNSKTVIKYITKFKITMKITDESRLETKSSTAFLLDLSKGIFISAFLEITTVVMLERASSPKNIPIVRGP
jgi:hypothetical protein